MDALIIVNPISGTTDKTKACQRVSKTLRDHGWTVSEAWTQGPGDATRLARQAAADGLDAVVTIGGDGTVNEVACGLIGTRTALGIIPCGSGNGLARHLCIPMSVSGAANVLVKGHVVDCDYGMAGDMPFTCTFGMGFDAWVSDKFAHKGHRGKLTYASTIIQEFVHYAPATYTVKAGGEIITDKAFLVTVCNASQYGNNVYIAPAASVRDGLFDVTIIHYDNVLTNAMAAFDMLTGMVGANLFTHTLRAESVTITRDHEGPAHIDGEPLLLGTEIECRCHRGGLNIIVPLTKPKFTPIVTPIVSAFKGLIGK